MMKAEHIEKVLENREKSFEKKAEAAMQFESASGAKIKGLFELVQQIKDPRLMSDVVFYYHAVKGDFVKWIKKISDDKSLITRIEQASEKVRSAMGIPADVPERDIKYLLAGKERKKKIDKSRKDVAASIGEKEKEKEKAQLIKKLKREEDERLDKVLERAKKLAEEGEKIEQMLIKNMQKRLELLNKSVADEKRALELLKLEIKSDKDVNNLKKAIERDAENLKNIAQFDSAIEKQEDGLIKIKNQVKIILEREFGREASAVEKETTEIKWKKEIEERKIRRMRTRLAGVHP